MATVPIRAHPGDVKNINKRDAGCVLRDAGNYSACYRAGLVEFSYESCPLPAFNVGGSHKGTEVSGRSFVQPFNAAVGSLRFIKKQNCAFFLT